VSNGEIFVSNLSPAQEDGAMIAPDILFKAVYREMPVIVTHATYAELELLAGEVGSAKDTLLFWSLIAIRTQSGKDIFALGWHQLLAHAWTTSSVAAVDFVAGSIRTKEGNTYSLLQRDDFALHPALRDHLAYSLWVGGFDDIHYEPTWGER
jgi:hypothetical protein